MRNYLKRKTKTPPALWEKLRVKVLSLFREDAKEHWSFVCSDQDEVLNLLLEYALSCEIMSQVFLEAASDIHDSDMYDTLLYAIKENNVAIDTYKLSVAKDIASEYKSPDGKLRFYMKGADA